MKNLKKYISLVLLFQCLFAFAQAPQKMSYQAVVRNASGNLVANTAVGMRISILQSSETGTAIYVETHSATTNTNGLVTIEVGAGTTVSGNFSQINWGDASYFIKTETDPTGGSNYTINGTSQLLSVPYALYAAKSTNSGKTSIYLIGDITNNEAQAKLNNEFGPNTENIYIMNTTALNTVNLENASSLVNLVVENNAGLTTINLNSLTSTYGNFSVQNNPALTTINLPAFKESSGNIIFKKNAGLGAVFITAPAKIFGNLTVEENVALASLNLSGITVSTTLIRVLNNSALTSIDLSNLNTSGELNIYTQNLNQLSLTNYSSGLFILSGSKLTSLTLPAYSYGSFAITDNSLMTSINLPVFTNAYNSPTIVSNPLLTAISWPQWNSFYGTNFGANLVGNNLPSTFINEVLHKFLTLGPTSGKKIYLRQKQSAPAPPTGQGIIDKQTLIASGNTVDTN